MNPQSVLEQLRTLWGSLSRGQRIGIPLVALLVGAGLMSFSQWRRNSDFRPLFTDMASEDAGSVVAKLKERAVEYKVSGDGKTVLVPSEQVAETRLQLAAAGLPRTGRIGFELFDQTKLGSTDFAEQVNFRRALEGELERSIRSVTEVAQARVHLTFPKESVFLESRQPAKASVLLHLKDGVPLAPASVTAICHLVASAVEGLAPDAVSVMDAQGNLLSRPKKSLENGEVSDEVIEYRRKLEKDLLAKAEATLEPVVGSGRYRIGISVDCDFASGEQSEELYDPEKSVMLTSQKTEENSGGGSASAGVPGTASNLPRPAPRSGGSTNNISKRTENISFQSSRTVRKMRLPQGNIRRISASVLLDQTVRWDLQGGKQQRVLVPPTAESLRAIRELVAGAIGFVPARGDQLVIESLPFETTLRTPPPPLPVTQPKTAPQTTSPFPAWVPGWAQDWRVQAGAGGAILVLLLTIAVLFFRRRKRRSKTRGAVAEALPAPAEQGASGSTDGAQLPAGSAAARMLAEAQEKIAASNTVETLVEKLKTTVSDDPALAASVLRTWIEEPQP